MSIVNGLLTGGIVIGKICQSLADVFTPVYVHTDGIILGQSITSGGVTFYRKTKDGKSAIYMANTDTIRTVCLTVPNIHPDEEGVMYVLDPLTSIEFPDVVADFNPPDLNVTTGPVNPVDPMPGAGGKPVLVKLGFSGLHMGNTIKVGTFSLRCNTTQLVILSTAITTTAITYMYLQSNRGISTSSQNIIPRSNSATGADNESDYTIDFAELGFDVTQDSIDGQLTLECADSIEDLVKISKTPPVPLGDAERAFFNINV